MLALSNGIQAYIARVQEDLLLSYPMSVEKQTVDYESILTSFTGMTPGAVARDEDELDRVYVNQSLMQMVNAFISETLKTSKNMLKIIRRSLIRSATILNIITAQRSTFTARIRKTEL